MSKLIKGDKLTPQTRDLVLRSFVHRLTLQNKHRNSFHASVPAITDAEWLAAHAFYVNNDGSLDARRNYCEPAYLAD